MITALAGVALYALRGKVDVAYAVLVGVPAMGGALIGHARAATALRAGAHARLRRAARGDRRLADRSDERDDRSSLAVAPRARSRACLSGLFGVGGGILFVPTLVALGLGQVEAAATSLLAVVPTAAVGDVAPGAATATCGVRAGRRRSASRRSWASRSACRSRRGCPSTLLRRLFGVLLARRRRAARLALPAHRRVATLRRVRRALLSSLLPLLVALVGARSPRPRPQQPEAIATARCSRARDAAGPAGRGRLSRLTAPPTAEQVLPRLRVSRRTARSSGSASADACARRAARRLLERPGRRRRCSRSRSSAARSRSSRSSCARASPPGRRARPATSPPSTVDGPRRARPARHRRPRTQVVPLGDWGILELLGSHGRDRCRSRRESAKATVDGAAGEAARRSRRARRRQRDRARPRLARR